MRFSNLAGVVVERWTSDIGRRDSDPQGSVSFQERLCGISQR